MAEEPTDRPPVLTLAAMIKMVATMKRQRQQRVFESVSEARASLSVDKLGAAYVSATGVFVVTAHGTGRFTTAEWRGEGK